MVGFDEFSFANSFISIMFFIVFGIIAFTIIKGIFQWSKNNNEPLLTVPAKVVTKRSNTSGGSGNSSAHTSYYVTFEVQSGDRLELKMNGHNYGQLADGDYGLLTFQGTRYHTFERHKKESSV
ncbi:MULTISPECIES: DUF2500 domain-containing protein [unclassified Lysinibacillus]|uniref:DUF2500 domain-containing protein n=1 Tax=unclassified Lysinibacillus TaxID=2636778 RepID=UPI00201308E6|nr:MULTISPECIES: DUF2500 domain-containing protein [unclassified Lysinibacillus]MCL1697077.1 DUF2500 domain-containing protein [Lysinibacillus sp. BPa_S21]MCL1701993.1 DUF2500 domain-containing protein [Lysinibacillus sp. Bpr_S20]